MANQVAHHPLGWINDALYRLRNRPHRPNDGIVDVTSGNNGIGPFVNSDGNTYEVPGYDAGTGYDLASGLGTIDAKSFVRALANAGGGFGH